jgi:RND family efflux transporter MFP subunit
MTDIRLQKQESRSCRGRLLHAAGLLFLTTTAVATVGMSHGRHQAEATEARVRADALRQGTRVVVAAARRAPATRSFVLQGDVRAFRQATVYAKVSGYLRNLRVERGDAVRAGDILGVIESPESVQQELSARAELALREKTENRVRALAPSGVVSQQEMDDATSGLAVARAESARIRALRGYEVLRAPFSGRITARYVDPGALLSAATAATQSAQPVLELADTRRVRIFVYPGQLDAPHVHEHDRVIFWTDAEPNRRRAAEILRTTNALDPRTRTMLAEIDVENRDQSLQPGSYVHVELSVPAAGGVVVPADALLIKGGKPHAAVVAQQHVHFTPVEVVDDDGTAVRISSGLAEGEPVVLHPSDDVIEGGKVVAVVRREDK